MRKPTAIEARALVIRHKAAMSMVEQCPDVDGRYDLLGEVLIPGAALRETSEAAARAELEQREREPVAA